MTPRIWPILALLIISLKVIASAQAQTTDDGSAASRSVPRAAVSGIVGEAPAQDESTDDLPRIPATLGGRQMSLAFLPELERSNYLRGGLNVGVGYDDNALLTPSSQVGNTSFSVFPNLAIDQSTPRMRWTLAYGAGLTVNQRLSARDQGSHDFNLQSEFRLSPHINLRADEDFSLVTGVFGAANFSGTQPPGGGQNNSLITPLANTRSSRTSLDSTYHYALRDVVGAGASYYNLHYSDVSTGPGTLSDTRTTSASGFWLHQLLRDDWIGVTYKYSLINYGLNGNTLVHSFVLTNSISFSKAFSLSGYIGPQHSNSHGVAASGPDAGQVTDFSGWSVAGGIELGWHGQRTSIAAGYADGTSDGGGVFGAARLQSVHASVRREIFPGWAASLGVAYASNDALTLATATTATSISTATIDSSLERSIGKSWGVQVRYFHNLQDQSGAVVETQNFNASRNAVSLTLSYQWAKPLGR